MAFIIGIIERRCKFPKTIVYCSIKEQGLSLIKNVKKSTNELHPSVEQYSAKQQAINYLNVKGHSTCCDIESDKNFWWVKIK